jgi:NAD(P)-dependent dehydrogenase (short-subunit alcohol dehydrogenase family)
LWEVDPKQWWNDVTVNLLGPMLMSQAVLPHMMQRDSGVIINMNGGGALSPLPGGSAYGCSKAALLRLTDTLARELERVGSHVLVAAMGPGFVRTEMTELQVNTEMGRKWIPSSKQAMDAGKTRSAEDCGRYTIELLKHLRPEFNGRIFGVGSNFAELANRAEEIVKNDLHTMRSK